MAHRSVVRQSWVSRYVQEISTYPLLTKAEEHDLALRMTRGDSAAASHDLVTSNLAFVVKIAHEYRSRGLMLGDLVNEGNIGLINAARHFDARRDTKFITYAIWWIRKSILKALGEQTTLVRVPTYQLKKVRNVRNTGRILSRELGREADRGEISKRLRVTIAQVDEILQLKMRELSLDDKVGRDKDTPISDYLVDRRSVNPEDEFIRHENHLLIRLALRSLTDQEQTVIINRFGLEDGRIFSLREIGAKLGVTRERVRQLESQAKKRLRKALARAALIAAAARRAVPPPGARLPALGLLQSIAANELEGHNPVGAPLSAPVDNTHTASADLSRRS